MKKTYTKGKTNVVWEPSKCIHSGVCVGGLPGVFKPREKPWIQLEGASEEEIRDQVMKCPSGALSLK